MESGDMSGCFFSRWSRSDRRLAAFHRQEGQERTVAAARAGPVMVTVLLEESNFSLGVLLEVFLTAGGSL